MEVNAGEKKELRRRRAENFGRKYTATSLEKFKN